MLKILITGGAGFIGSNLCDFLVDNGSKVCVVDDLSSGCKSNLLSINLDNLIPLNHGLSDTIKYIRNQD